MRGAHRGFRRVDRVVALVAGLLVALLVSVVPAPAEAGEAGAYARQAVRVTNKVRADHDLPRLTGQDCLQSFAVKQAKAMAAAEEMYHQQLAPILSTCGLVLVGENVAYGYPTGRAVVRQGWMKSPPHRANILEPGYRRMAIAARLGPDGRWYVCQLFGRAA